MRTDPGSCSLILCASIIALMILSAGCGGSDLKDKGTVMDPAQLALEHAEGMVYQDLDSTLHWADKAIALGWASGDTSMVFAGHRCIVQSIAHNGSDSSMIHRLSPQGLDENWGNYFHGVWLRGKHGQASLPESDSLFNQVVHLGTSYLQALAQIERVRIRAERKQPQQADSIALELINSAELSPTLLAELLNAQALAQLNNGAPDRALRIYQEAVVESSPLGANYQWASAELGKAYAQMEQAKFDEAGHSLARADSLFTVIGDLRDRITALDGIGYCFWDVLEAGKVIGYWREALNLADSLHDDRRGALVRLNIARFHVGLDSAECRSLGLDHADRFDTAYKHIAIAREVAERSGDHTMYGRSINIESGVLNRQGRFMESVALAQRSFRHFQSVGEVQWSCSSLISEASNRIAMEDWTGASLLLERALPMADAAGLINLRLLALNRLYHVRKNQGRFEQALELLERRDAVKDSVESIEVVDKLAQLELRGRFEKKQLSDSLAHDVALALEHETSRTRIEQQRTRTRMIAVGGSILLLVGAFGFVLDRKRRKERYGKQAAMLETKALRAQMNPHFIFNALNSISAFIREQQPEKAHGFIARFGRLMRLVLENSRKAEVPLSTDLEALRIYLELEQARSSDKFRFTITVDPAIDVEEVMVPPLVLQPFVENAIWHGMDGKEGQGHIELSIVQQGNQLIMAVSDDGIGRKATLAITGGTENSTVKKGSLGTTITRERLELLQKQKGRPAGFRYLEQLVGTRVELTVPI